MLQYTVGFTGGEQNFKRGRCQKGGGGRTTVLECLIVPAVLPKTLHSPDKVLTFLNKIVFDRVDDKPSSFQETFVHLLL